MAKVVVLAEVDDTAAWEAKFRTRASLFREQSVTKPVHFGFLGANQVAVCVDPDDLAKCIEIMGQAVTKEAMIKDGVKLESVRVFVLNQQLEV